MRIIAGAAGGIPLKVPPGMVRPTTDRVREAVFAILGELVCGARVADLFAGSGSLGLEALSRGAGEATFVDADRGAVEAVRENLRKARLGRGQVVRGDVFRFLRRAGAGRYDLVFADPPYRKHPGGRDLAGELMGMTELAEVVVAGGRIVLETAAGASHGSAPPLTLIDHRTYGSTAVWIFERSAPADEMPSRPADL